MQETDDPTDTTEAETASRKTGKKPTEKPWQPQSGETYRKTAEKLVHFSVKTVNSNARAAGIRLSPDDGLQLPYVSARTLLGYGCMLELDYAEGGAAQAGIIKQIMTCERNDPFAEAATEAEKTAIRDVLPLIRQERFETGTDSVDLRLRQILIPKASAKRAYVAITPVTSGSVCHYLFNSDNGLVPAHQEKARTAEKKKSIQEGSPEETGPGQTVSYRRIRQARFGIGGSNPQNVGRLTRSMQEPIVVNAPTYSRELRTAFRFYYQGIELDFQRPGALRQSLENYAAFRAELIGQGAENMPTNMLLRKKENRLVREIGEAVLAQGRYALALLQQHAGELPREHRLEFSPDEMYEPVSRQVSTVIRGLIDPRLRESDVRTKAQGKSWARAMAEHVVSAIEATGKNRNKDIRLLPLDQYGKADLEAQLEDYFR